MLRASRRSTSSAGLSAESQRSCESREEIPCPACGRLRRAPASAMPRIGRASGRENPPTGPESRRRCELPCELRSVAALRTSRRRRGPRARAAFLAGRCIARPLAWPARASEPARARRFPPCFCAVSLSMTGSETRASCRFRFGRSQARLCLPWLAGSSRPVRASERGNAPLPVSPSSKKRWVILRNFAFCFLAGGRGRPHARNSVRARRLLASLSFRLR